MDIDQAVVCDRQRLGQLLGNLVTNAVTHGDPDIAVTVRARGTAHAFELSVTNGTAEMTPFNKDRVFQPFCRTPSSSDAPGRGLGLGLYIAAEIAASHGGTLQMTLPAEQRICFTFCMSVPPIPLGQHPPPDENVKHTHLEEAWTALAPVSAQ